MAINTKQSNNKIPYIDQCDSTKKNRENQTVVSDLDGSLLLQRSAFPYYALMAFDLGGILRLTLLILSTPIAALFYHLISESLGIQALIFVTFAGAKLSSIKSAASAVLPKHYSEDLNPETWRVFSSCGKKWILTANPRIMVEPFLKNYLGVDLVLGTELSSYKGVATGLVGPTGVLVGRNKAVALSKALSDGGDRPDIGIGDRKTDLPFMRMCKERYIVPSARPNVKPVKPETLPKPVIFHDGRLVQRPTPLIAAIIVLWFPIGVILSIARVFICAVTPISILYYVLQFLGSPIKIKGQLHPQIANRTPPSRRDRGGVAFVCSHRCVLDAVYVSACLRCMTTTISYSVPSFTESLSPIRTVRLTRDRATDARLIEAILSQGKYLVMCPEGTTCREPYLLRFSSLFAELTDQIVPVAIRVRTSLFHGTTARGHKWLDPFFFCMNPFPAYEVTFLEKLPAEETCGGGGKSSHEVANRVQELIGRSLGYECTNLTRKDKYRALAGNDGTV